jgi:SNF2 family DNA or RNA helicase
MAEGFSPAVVACQTHLQAQWKDEAEKFLDGVKVHVAKSLKTYDLPDHDLLIVPYSKLREWGHVLTGYKLAAFDEAQELRKRTSAKYQGAAALANACDVAVGLTATPVYNYGDEIFSVIDVLSEGALGTFDEFTREWATPWGQNYRVDDPPALHSFLNDQNLLIRRRRSEVGRELPPKTRVVQTVEYDKRRIAAMNDELVALAKTVVAGEFTERGRATRELNLKLRQATGVAKAPAVADVVKDLVGAGEAPVVFGWHREFYAVLESELRRAGIKCSFYTGSETAKQKIDSVADFVSGSSDVFVMSLRSGAGLNGLQERASIAVFGELDWSPQVHLQGEGRLARDGQNRNVTSLFLVAEGGSDPVVANMLGIKEEQGKGIVGDEVDEAAAQVVEARGKALAEELLARTGKNA